MNGDNTSPSHDASSALLAPKTVLVSFLFSCFNLWAIAAESPPELKGTPADLAMLLTNAPRFAQVTGEAELKVPADRIQNLQSKDDPKLLAKLVQELQGK